MLKNLLFLALCSVAQALPTYFDYPELKGSSDRMISEESLDKWDRVLTPFLKQKSDEEVFVFYTYLYIAQRDAAFLSYNTHHCFEGSLDPLNLKLVHLFFPEFTPSIQIESDNYSEELAITVFKKFRAHYKKEKKARWPLWYPSNYEVPPPPTAPSREVKKLHKIRRSMSTAEEKTGEKWRMIAKPGEENWIDLTNRYMKEHRTPLGKQLQVRASLMMALTDAFAVAHIAKEKYQIPRPYTVEPETNTLIERPTSMSYPSGHASLSGAAAEVLSTYFPEDSKLWLRLAKEMAYSRIWSGVHYPMDVSEGLSLGREVAKGVLAPHPPVDEPTQKEALTSS
ncbi:MAG: hypothetical protein S4CHLAM45_01470 [Chlamydiales bacterium]|nr:hypothetical protein [Chlamydiales bacterium]MCH9619467.1 hypothetical protein [Chlamydiales bacterium]MCH9622271.1 hypothetical protein [Chlamydiales bacterium]